MRILSKGIVEQWFTLQKSTDGIVQLETVWRRMRSLTHVLILLACSGSPVRADIGVPMIFVTTPLMLIALAPVILIESVVLIRKLNIDWRTSIKAVTAANLFSTLIGIPLTWFCSS